MDVRLVAQYGLKSDMVGGPKSARFGRAHHYIQLRIQLPNNVLSQAID